MAKIQLNIINCRIFIISLFVINSQDTDTNKDIRILNYYYSDGKIYSIEEREQNFLVKIKEVIFCFTTPCIPPILDEIKIEDNENCQDLKALFDEILKDSEIKEKNLIDEELTAEQREIIIDFLQNNQIISEIKYKIGKGLVGYSQEYEERGFIYEIHDDYALCTIFAGMKPSAGYLIEVEKIKVKGDKVIIYAFEVKPEGGADTVVTYPYVEVSFYLKMPSIIEVIVRPNGEKLPRLN